MTSAVNPGVKNSFLASPYMIGKLLHRLRQPLPWDGSSSSCDGALHMMLRQGGHFLWDGSSDQRFHVQIQNPAFSHRPPLVIVWLSESGGHDNLAVSLGQAGPTAAAIHDSAILVSPHSNLKQ